jgi:hypothetical protein
VARPDTIPAACGVLPADVDGNAASHVRMRDAMNPAVRGAGRAVIPVILAAALGAALAWPALARHSAGHPPASGRALVRVLRLPAPGQPDIPAALSPGERASAVPAVATITSVGSLNWAGYAVSRPKTTFGAVQATFFVPYVNCTASPGATRASFWVGLDGYQGAPDSVEQTGVGADCSAAGKASYFSWFEMYPYAQTKLPLTVHAGDSVTASVSYITAKKDFRLSLTDNTRGGSATKLRKCPDIKVSGKKVKCPRTSAEVIAEAPASGSSSHLVIDPLSDYGAVSFAGISISSSAGKHGGILSSHWTATKIIQVRASGGPTLAMPTSMEGDMFDTYWFRED